MHEVHGTDRPPVRQPGRPHRSRLSRACLLLATAGFAVVAGHALTHAQAPGAPPERTVWDGVYTDAQADRATGVFGQRCANCHTLDATGARPLSGAKFWEGYTQLSVVDFIDYVRTAMPNGNGNSLPEATYNDLVALIFRANGLPSGTTELSPEAATGVQIVPKDGPGLLPGGSLVRVVGCLVRNGTEWVVSNVPPLVRVRRGGSDPADVSRPLGEQAYALRFVITRLDRYEGHRVSVNGLLIGDGGSGGINLSGLTSLAPTCP
ncbi:MAG: c-type cytochrome [Vicinamibacterales bacterium]